MTILILAEHNNATLSHATRSAVAAAAQIGGEVHILVAGHNAGEAAKQAAGISGVAKVLHADAPHYAWPLPENIAPLVASIGKNYTHILATATTTGKDIMPRAAALLDTVQVSDIIAVLAPVIIGFGLGPISLGAFLASVASGARISGPAGQRLVSALDAAPRFSGTFLSAADLNRVKRDTQLRVYDNPKQFLTCLFDPNRAACLHGRTSRSTEPRLDHCAEHCANIARTDRQVADMQREVTRLRREAASPATPEPLAQRMLHRADTFAAAAAHHNATSAEVTLRATEPTALAALALRHTWLLGEGRFLLAAVSGERNVYDGADPLVADRTRRERIGRAQLGLGRHPVGRVERQRQAGHQASRPASVEAAWPATTTCPTPATGWDAGG